MLYAGLIVNGALYLIGLLVLGILWDRTAAEAALIAAGVTYLCYLVQTFILLWPNCQGLLKPTVFVLLVASIGFGAFGGFHLLFGAR
jgi:hypothetical protein